MPIGDPRDEFFYPTLTLKIDPYIYYCCYNCCFIVWFLFCYAVLSVVSRFEEEGDGLLDSKFHFVN